MAGFRRGYGDSPLHALLMLSSFALTAYAGARLLDGDVRGVVLWFVGAAVLHDLVLLPVYGLADRGVQALVLRGGRSAAPAGAPQRRQGINFIRVPVLLSGLLLLVWFPLILDRVDRYEAYTGLPAGVFWERWLLATAGLFATSALCFIAWLWHGRPARTRPRIRRPRRHLPYLPWPRGRRR
ncbi:hypothetical protein [Streptomyces sp. XD-27]|uniref:hypothetical protein n=1 Tax=Streptomyces sp. XD-27 TaxID=3062779 RepID=UPI0026F45330|nr:hypothetical protein [Streptomyces sp. XD-27]WKX68828.1 hypothetical protein Q3Y56_01835 [Streptomyces sp. XD-27]